MHTREYAGNDDTYESYELSFNSYHRVIEPVVLAWRVQLCDRRGDMPLWDSCRIALRGFPTTDYLGKSSEMAEIEGRWQLSRRWGVVGFTGAGQIHDSLAGVEDSEIIPSYGVGLRFMVDTQQRINLRVDYARSADDDAIYVFVGEQF